MARKIEIAIKRCKILFSGFIIKEKIFLNGWKSVEHSLNTV